MWARPEVRVASTRQVARWGAERHLAPAPAHPCRVAVTAATPGWSPPPPAASSPPRSCSDPHRRAGVLRDRLGASMDEKAATFWGFDLTTASPTFLGRGGPQLRPHPPRPQEGRRGGRSGKRLAFRPRCGPRDHQDRPDRLDDAEDVRRAAAHRRGAATAGASYASPGAHRGQADPRLRRRLHRWPHPQRGGACPESRGWGGRRLRCQPVPPGLAWFQVNDRCGSMKSRMLDVKRVGSSVAATSDLDRWVGSSRTTQGVKLSA
jgi:hypothetical protein